MQIIGRIYNTYFKAEDFEESPRRKFPPEFKLKNTEAVRNRVHQRMAEMKKGTKEKAYRALLDEYKKLVSEM